MKLRYMVLKNFRQFYGTTPKIHFASGDRNITVLHANNGSGKTALLNAFTWSLFNEHTPGFQLPDQIVNKRAIREAKIGEAIEAYVELKFSHAGSTYVLRRTQETIRTENDPGWLNHSGSTVSLKKESGNGNWRLCERPEDEIGKILPKDLHNYFFFDGERIERIVRPTKRQQEEIRAAAKKLLGLEVVERGSNHLGATKKLFEKELRDSGNEEISSLIKEKEALEKSSLRFQEEKQQIENELECNDAIIKTINKSLLSHQEVKGIQQRRRYLEEKKEEKSSEINGFTKELKQLVAKNGYIVFLKKLLENFRSQIDLMRQKGELPSGIKKQFVEDLLEKHECICGTILRENEPAYEKVKRWRQQAGLADVEEKALSLGGELKAYEETLSQLPSQLEDLKREIAQRHKEIAEIESELDDISSKLLHSPKEEIAELEKRLEECRDKKTEFHHKLGELNGKIELTKDDISKIDKIILQKKSEEEKQNLLLRRMKACSQAQEVLDKMMTLWDEKFRLDLEIKMQSLFKEMTLTPYIPQISPSYGIVLQEEAGGNALDVAASQGENQILSLSFIGSIIEVVREQKLQHEALAEGGIDASSYPVVMDSPFGALDHNYRAQIAKHLPCIADQIITMVTKTQWRGEVEHEMADKIGREYVLTYFTPREDIQEDWLEIEGEKVPLVKQSSNDYEYTKVQEITNVRR